MAHFAEIDSENKVVRVLVIDNSKADNAQEFLSKELNLGGTWIQTSYNTRGGLHYGADGKPDGGKQIGYNYAGIGYIWDGIGFAAPQPFPSWTLDKTTYLWNAPVEQPTIDKTKYPDMFQILNWDETDKKWTFIQPFPSWTLDSNTGYYIAPVTYPTDEAQYFWDETNKTWEKVPNSTITA